MTQKKKLKKSQKKNNPKTYIKNWLKTFVEVPHPVFAGMPPCPFARQARLKNKIKFNYYPSPAVWMDMYVDIVRCDFDKFDVLAMIIDADQFSAKETKRIARDLNREFKEDDLVILEDHPDIPEKVKQVSLNNGKYILFLAQRLSKLTRFSNQLKNTKYYKNWTKAHLKDVVNWRGH
tara:strand:- start:907 stop:1437 length:531 start_codon:yes stop_codon:yes gene_type:complete